MATSTSPFLFADQPRWEAVAEGVRRQVLTYDERLMVVKVAFDQGGIGSRHRHLHVQMTYVECGVFKVTIADEEHVLRVGDSFHVPSDEWHSVECLEAGTLLDVFSPARTEFLL
jgi:quercetin dioxygenase-like cupin family protein